MEISKPISVIIALTISLTIFLLFVLPKYQESEALGMELMQRQAQYEGRVDYYAKVADVLRGIEQKQDALGKIDSALPSNFTVAPIVYFFQEKARESNVSVKSVSFFQQNGEEVLVEVPAREIKEVELRVELSGSYQGLKDFLRHLENSARLFEVNSIVFASDIVPGSGTTSVSQSYDFVLEIKTHTY